jgi:hypothetical protein
VGAALFIALPWAVGHGFDHDPLFPGTSGGLNDPRVRDPARRVERFDTRAKLDLGAALADLERR